VHDVPGSELAAGITPSLDVLADFSKFELSPEACTELLDPEDWSEVLEAYAHTVHLAVALTDAGGLLLGNCHNARPIWRMVRQAQPPVPGACAFCLAPAAPCAAAADAVRSGEVMLVHDGIGMAHVAVPLSLGGRNLGALIAGQVFDQYPQSLPLQRAARSLGFSSQSLWHQAIHEVPISRATLEVFATLLMRLGQSFLAERYAATLHQTLADANISIRRSLEEKEVMLKEIQHRVKNNLQIVSSLLNMQSSGLHPTEDATALQVLAASQQRVAGMARIHDLLYEVEEFGRIDLASYVKDLAGMAISSFQTETSRIRPRYSLEAVPLSMRQAVPCGLIVNELITNVFKYAYPNNAPGEIFIEVKPSGDTGISITIADSGVGLPEGLDWLHADSVGSKIIRVLTKQLRGTLELDSQSGTSVTLRFTRDLTQSRSEIASSPA
jgi:two-component sensor histidine kinase